MGVVGRCRTRIAAASYLCFVPAGAHLPQQGHDLPLGPAVGVGTMLQLDGWFRRRLGSNAAPSDMMFRGVIRGAAPPALLTGSSRAPAGPAATPRGPERGPRGSGGLTSTLLAPAAAPPPQMTPHGAWEPPGSLNATPRAV